MGVYHALCCILSVNKIYEQIEFELIPAKPARKSVKNSYERVYFRCQFRLQRWGHIQNDLLHICFLQILLAGRLIRSYLNVDTISFKLL